MKYGRSVRTASGSDRLIGKHSRVSLVEVYSRFRSLPLAVLTRGSLDCICCPESCRLTLGVSSPFCN